MRERRTRTAQFAIGVLVSLAIQSLAGSADARDRSRDSETRINQASGNLPPSAHQIDGKLKRPRGAPEGAPDAGTASIGPTAPVTCNQQNALSPACYSATQQARPVTR